MGVGFARIARRRFNHTPHAEKCEKNWQISAKASKIEELPVTPHRSTATRRSNRWHTGCVTRRPNPTRGIESAAPQPVEVIMITIAVVTFCSLGVAAVVHKHVKANRQRAIVRRLRSQFD